MHRIFYFPETSRKRLKISKLPKSYCFRYVKVRNLKAIYNEKETTGRRGEYGTAIRAFSELSYSDTKIELFLPTQGKDPGFFCLNFQAKAVSI